MGKSKPRINPQVKRKAEQLDRMRKKVAVKQGPKKICLTMIVRNESNNMKRLLDSVKSIIDMVSIVDTGSTDNTEEVIMEWSKENDVPTTVHHEPFQDFSYNRTHSVQAAKKAYPEADYLLLSDADFVWEIDKGGKFDKKLLIDHKYLIEQYNKSLTYWNVRMLNAKVDWFCEGVTHEYWREASSQSEYSGEIRTARIRTLAIDDREDGGFKSEKFTRDERLLRGGLADPETKPSLKTRYKFYLGQTLKDMGRFEESIEWYEKRIADKGWYEEVYYSKFQIGVNYEQIGWKKRHVLTLMAKADKTPEDFEFINKWDPENKGPAVMLDESTKCFQQAAANYLGAYNFCKRRAESLYYVTRMYRSLGQNEMAYKFAKMGQKIVFPENDSLFIERACYDYLFDYEISIVAWHIEGKRDEGRECINKLLPRDDLPDNCKEIVMQNSRAYL